MPKLEEAPAARTGQREVSPTKRPTRPAGEELSDDAIRAIEEGRADHAAGRTFTLPAIKRELGIDS